MQIALYGLPPAGVLGLELLQQSCSPSQDARLSESVFPRAEIIQNLAVLISSMDHIVRPTNGNCDICGQAKKMLQAILNTVLTPPLQASLPAPATMASRPMDHRYANGTGSQTTNGQTVQVETNGRDLNSQKQQLVPDMNFDSNTVLWLDDLNFDMDFWNSLEDHPLLA